MEKDINRALIHGLSNKPSNNSSSIKEINFIKNFKLNYPNISIQQFMDIYHEDIIFNQNKQDIVIKNNLKKRSYSFYENLFKKFNWPKPNSYKNIKDYTYHPLREPMPNRGILIIIDGTPNDWLQNNKNFSLHMAIDDATGEILAGYFMPEECLLGYLRILDIILKKYGIPENIYCDIHTILNKKEEELFRLAKICENLKINLITTYTVPSKGKIENKNRIIQNRLINDLKRFDIKKYNKLNDWFNSFYVEYLNKKYSYNPKNTKNHFLSTKNLDLSNMYYIKIETEMLDGNIVNYKDNFYKVINNGKYLNIVKGYPVVIYINILLDNEIKLKYDDKFYKLIKLNNSK